VIIGVFASASAPSGNQFDESTFAALEKVRTGVSATTDDPVQHTTSPESNDAITPGALR
jgi:hypothetical protein